MDDRLAALEQEVGRLSRLMEDFEQRLGRVEGSGPDEAVAAPMERLTEPGSPVSTERPPEPAARVRERRDAGRVTVLIGRTLVAVGGGYLFRALAESGTVPRLAGIALGLVYASVWLVLADRAAGQKRRLGASFHGLTATLLVLPLLWETTVRFRDLEPAAAMAILGFFAAMQLLVAYRRDLRALAWLPALGFSSTALAMALGLRELVAGTILLIVLATTVLALGALRGWPVVAGVSGTVASLGLFLVDLGALVERAPFDRVAAVMLQVGFFVLITIAVLGLRAIGRPAAGWLELTHLGAASVLGHFAAVTVVYQRLPELRWPMGLVSVGVGAIGYALLLRRRRDIDTRGFEIAGAAASVLLLGGLGLATPSPTIAWSLAAVGLAWLGARVGWTGLWLHASALAGVAGIAALVLPAVTIFRVDEPALWPRLGVAWPIVLLAVVLCEILAPRGVEGWPDGLTAGAAAMLLAIAGVGVASLLVRLAAPALAGDPISAAALAAVRTVALAVVSVMAGTVSRFERAAPAARLAYPLLILIALKLLAQDFPGGTGTSLFVALATYGLAVAVTPRLLARRWDRR